MELGAWNLEIIFGNDTLGSIGFGTLVYPK